MRSVQSCSKVSLGVLAILLAAAAALQADSPRHLGDGVIGSFLFLPVDEAVDADGDGLGDHWETFWFGSPEAADPGTDTDGDGVTNLEEYLQRSNPVKLVLPPTCSYGPEDFYGGLDGYCTETADQTFDLYFEDWNGIEVYSISWPGPLENPPAADCDILCEAGALAVAYDTNRFNLQRPDGTAVLWKSPVGIQLAPVPGYKACPLQPNGKESYKQCVGGAAFDCFLACGKGCVGCEVSTAGNCSQGGQICQKHDFECYQRPCCVTHDRCLAAAKNFWEELKCHREALANGCNMDDARGTTHGAADAVCFNPPQQCLRVGGLPVREACCMDSCETECQDLEPQTCFEMGGVAQGPGSTCDDVEPVPVPTDETL